MVIELQPHVLLGCTGRTSTARGACAADKKPVPIKSSEGLATPILIGYAGRGLWLVIGLACEVFVMI
jgi:hypothetical protein